MSKKITTECAVTIDGKVQAIRVLLINDGTGDADVANYDVEFHQAGKRTATTRIENWRRGAGVVGLIGMLMLEFDLTAERQRGRSMQVRDQINGGTIPAVAFNDAMRNARFPKTAPAEAI